jgi:hypothetical protein
MKNIEEAEDFYERTIRMFGYAARTHCVPPEQIVNLA